jgi:adenosylcobyric acid synthase
VKPPLGHDVLSVAVARLGHISNFTDFDALAHEPGVSVRFTGSAEEILDADLAVIPGTKATVEDLNALRSRGLDNAFAARMKRGLPTLGICGGYQMLGNRIEDGVESNEPETIGLGLLPVETVFEREKSLGRPEGTAIGFGNADVSGYEIHHGRNLDWRPGDQSFAAAREAQLERLGDLVADNVDREPLMRLIDDGPPSGLPVVRLQATGYRPQPGDSNGVSVPEESRPAGVETTSSASSASAAADAMPATRNLRPDA